MQLLCAIDPESLDPFERVQLVQAWERQHAWLAVRQQEALAAAAGAEPLTPDDWAAEEIASAIKVSGRTAQNRIHVARALTELLPKTRAALEGGELSFSQALAIVDECATVDRETTTAIEDCVFPGAGERSIGDLRRKVRGVIAAVARPGMLDDRLQSASFRC